MRWIMADLPTLTREPATMPLKKTVGALARQYGSSGAISILKLPDGNFRTAVSGLTDDEIKDALYIGIHSHFLMMEEEAADG